MDDVMISPGEKILLRVRYHPIMMLPVLISTVLLYVFTTSGFYLLGRYGDWVSQIVPLSIASLLLAVMLAVITAIILLSIFVYSRSSLILTDENLIQIKQVGVFHRKVSVLSLSHIEDVTGSSKGVLATVLGFGDIFVETAGEQHNFTFTPVANPYPIVEMINRAHQEFERKQGGGSPEPVSQPAQHNSSAGAKP